VIAKVLAGEPAPVRQLQPVTPPGLERVLSACLAKNPNERWQSVTDLKLALRLAEHPAARAKEPARRLRLRAAAAVAILLLGVAAGWLARSPEPARSLQFAINPPPETEFVSAGTNAGNSALSPDGTMLAFSARTKGKIEIWVRRLDAVEARALPGTEDGYYPFWSPDSRHIGFFAQGKLKRIDVAGGPARTICDARPGRGGTWNADGVILFSGAPAMPDRRILRVPAAGGTPTPVTTLEASENAHYWPSFLPDGRHFLYTARSTELATGGIWVASLDSPGNRKKLVDSLSNAAYALPSPAGWLSPQPGHLLFASEQTLLAQPFDASSLEFKGEAFPLAEGISYASNIALADFSVSANGVLAYGSGGASLFSLVWRDRSGKQTGTFTGTFSEGAPGLLGPVELSPDDKRILFLKFGRAGSPADYWVGDLARGIQSRLTFDSLSSPPFGAVWCDGGQHVVYRAGDKIYRRAADGAGEAKELLAMKNAVPADCAPDGRFVLLVTRDPKTQRDLMVLEAGSDRDPVPYLATSFDEFGARFSPDGRWIAYASDDSGTRQSQVYVRSFVPGKPASGARWQVSTDGGFAPLWRGDGKELFYMSPRGKLLAVPVQAQGDTLRTGTPATLFEAQFALAAVTRDGQRFLGYENVAAGVQTMTVTVNWRAGLKR
jgi:Tol biopolymer transport system component